MENIDRFRNIVVVVEKDLIELEIHAINNSLFKIFCQFTFANN